MELKLFAAKREDPYSGGLIVVAANSIDEAYQTYTDWAESTNNSHYVYWKHKYSDGTVEVDDRYPKENWYEIPDVKVICDEPQVIDEDGYTE